MQSVSVFTALFARFLRTEAGYLLPADTIWMLVSIGTYCALNGELTVASCTSTIKIATYESCICLHSSFQYALRVVVFTPFSDTWGVNVRLSACKRDVLCLMLIYFGYSNSSYLFGSSSVSEFTDLKIVWADILWDDGDNDHFDRTRSPNSIHSHIPPKFWLVNCACITFSKFYLCDCGALFLRLVVWSVSTYSPIPMPAFATCRWFYGVVMLNRWVADAASVYPRNLLHLFATSLIIALWL